MSTLNCLGTSLTACLSFDRHDAKFIWAGDNQITGEPANAIRTIRDPDFNNFAPRAGLAFRFNPKTILRAGYGIFYIHNYLWELQGHRGSGPMPSARVSVCSTGARL